MTHNPLHRLLKLELKFASINHHVDFLQHCTNISAIPKRLFIHKSTAGMSINNPSILSDWDAAIVESSLKLRDIALRNARANKQDLAVSIETVTNEIIDAHGLRTFVSVKSDVDRVLTRFNFDSQKRHSVKTRTTVNVSKSNMHPPVSSTSLAHISSTGFSPYLSTSPSAVATTLDWWHRDISASDTPTVDVQTRIFETSSDSVSLLVPTTNSTVSSYRLRSPTFTVLDESTNTQDSCSLTDCPSSSQHTALNSDPRSTLLPASDCVFHLPLYTSTQMESTTVSTPRVHSTSVDHLESSDHVFSSVTFSRPTRDSCTDRQRAPPSEWFLESYHGLRDTLPG